MHHMLRTANVTHTTVGLKLRELRPKLDHTGEAAEGWDWPAACWCAACDWLRYFTSREWPKSPIFGHGRPFESSVRNTFWGWTHTHTYTRTL